MLLRHCLLVCCALMGLLGPAAHANTEPRLALLIGNASYKASPLANPVNDVRLMEGALKEAGFTVIKAENASIRDMRRLVRDFGDKLKASGGVGLFYFAGHGVQVRGENFLVSTDSDIRNEDEVADEALNASVILEKMQTAGNRMNLIILDACRNNPFAVKSRSAVPGLATMSAPSGSLVAYSTAPGSVASDGVGKNGLYTEHLAKVLRQPGLPVEEVFKQVRAAVRKDSNNQQTPWENTALEGQFYFKPSGQWAAPAPGAAPVIQNAADLAAFELAFWDSVKNSQRPTELQAYLDRFPKGTFAMLATSRLQELSGGAAAPATVVPARIADSIPDPAAGTSVGTLVLTDSLTGIKRNVEVTVKETNAEKTVYSTGDEVAKDGRVLRIALGDALLRVTSGALWTIPVKAGVQGEAKLESWNGSFRGHSSISWKAVAVGGSQVRIDAIATISNVYGKFNATYSENQPLPDAFATQIRSNLISGELKMAKSWLQELSGGAAALATEARARILDSILNHPAGTSVGTLVLTDSLTGIKRNVEVTVKESNAEKTVYSTGDEVAKDGRVLRIALGDALLRVTSGALWTIPVKAGVQGEAKLESWNGSFRGHSSISWKAVAVGGSQVRIDAIATISNVYGKFNATYSENQPLPDAFATQIRSNLISGELKMAKSWLQELSIGTVKPANPGTARMASGPLRWTATNTSIGTVVLTDSRSGVKRNVDITVKESDAEKTVYSTGDEIHKDGRVLTIAVGDVLLRVVSGSLWSIPVKAGTQGAAKLERLNVNFKGSGAISWEAVATQDNRVRIEATATYPHFIQYEVYPVYGKLNLTYSADRELPDAFEVAVRGRNNEGNFIAAEFNLR